MCIRRFWCLSHLHYEQVNWPIQAAPSCLLLGAWVTRVELSAKEISYTNLVLAHKNQPSTSSFCTAWARMETMMKRAQTLLKEQNVSRRPRWRTWFMNGWMTHLCSSPHTCVVLPAFIGVLQQNIGVLLMSWTVKTDMQTWGKNLGKWKPEREAALLISSLAGNSAPSLHIYNHAAALWEATGRLKVRSTRLVSVSAQILGWTLHKRCPLNLMCWRSLELHGLSFCQTSLLT